MTQKRYRFLEFVFTVAVGAVLTAVGFAAALGVYALAKAIL